MKKLIVTIKLEMEVPDDWAVEKTDNGIDILRIGEGQFLDMSAEPLVSADKDGTWTTDYDDDFANRIFDMVSSEEISYELA
ncbi:MAG TPA: hypothetical protein PKM60_08125 [Zoogloea sp.]|jgi:hypothetical protein|uniref:hypothetical protein n=1 Tax=Zoogloea sp. TaxID=49181 RepID=UPI002B51821B|nr:hypothetical protein [Zoogloea sp.]HOB46122.1 hypothetical protein [Zoogloea sp.]HQA10087.1 hypothetical protein [Zoogloea sp.]HQE38995.1 hypothetical protein [Zoogloea sp.]